jgi:hypothetical protein
MVNLEKPDLFNGAVLGFLRDQPRRSSSAPPYVDSRSD